MMFVSGLMGPYMSPIPANASMAMLFSFFVAVTVTPWLMLRFARHGADGAGRGAWRTTTSGALGRFYAAVARPLLKAAARSTWIFLLVVGAATLASLRAVLHRRTSRSSCCPSTTSPSCRSSSTCREGTSRRGHRARAAWRPPTGCRTCRS